MYFLKKINAYENKINYLVLQVTTGGLSMGSKLYYSIFQLQKMNQLFKKKHSRAKN